MKGLLTWLVIRRVLLAGLVPLLVAAIGAGIIDPEWLKAVAEAIAAALAHKP